MGAFLASTTGALVGGAFVGGVYSYAAGNNAGQVTRDAAIGGLVGAGINTVFYAGAMAVRGGMTWARNGAASDLAGIEAKIASRTATRAEWQLYSRQLRMAGETAEFSGNGSFLQFDRRVIARQFLSDKGFSSAAIERYHLSGIDFSMPVSVETIPQGAWVEQWVKGGRIGNYFAPVGQAPEASGIARYMRTPIGFQATEDVQVLKCYAARITDTWTLGPQYPFQLPGRGVQYITNTPNIFNPVFGW